jgi:hypothetical protein
MTISTIPTHAGCLAAALLVALCLAPHPVAGASSATAGSVTVTVHYKGKGTVGENHRVWVWLFDTPDIGPSAMPIREESVTRNGGDVTIRGLTEKRVWIAVAFDERGGSAGNQPPASGSPIAIYSVDGGPPSGVEPADDPRAVVTFDDSMRMP